MLLGLSGYARAGKDTAANVLVGALGFERVAFADVLREAVYTLNPYVAPWQDLQSLVNEGGWEALKDPSCPKDTREEVRRLLQVMGTEVGRRMFGEDIWVDTLFSRLDPEKDYVISDCRFPNEAAKVKSNHGYVIRINRMGTEPINGHASETALDGYVFDAQFANDGSLEDLGHRLVEWVNAHRG